MKKILSLFVLLSFCAVSISCGYTAKSALPPNLKTVHVKRFGNEIDFTTEGSRNVYFPLLEVNVTNAIIDRYLFDGNLKISKEDVADLILQGKLVRYSRRALRYTDDDDVQEYRVRITVDMVLLDGDGGEPVWEEKGFSGEADYFVTGSNATTEDEAVARAQIDLARRVVERTIENW